MTEDNIIRVVFSNLLNESVTHFLLNGKAACGASPTRAGWFDAVGPLKVTCPECQQRLPETVARLEFYAYELAGSPWWMNAGLVAVAAVGKSRLEWAEARAGRAGQILLKRRATSRDGQRLITATKYVGQYNRLKLRRPTPAPEPTEPPAWTDYLKRLQRLSWEHEAALVELKAAAVDVATHLEAPAGVRIEVTRLHLVLGEAEQALKALRMLKLS